VNAIAEPGANGLAVLVEAFDEGAVPDGDGVVVGLTW
jgi:hypothetical protein